LLRNINFRGYLPLFNLLKEKFNMKKNEYNDNYFNLILNPHFVTGLIEAEGSFSILKHKDKRAKYHINISLSFRITMLSNEILLLNMINNFFGCGYLSIENKRGAVTFAVQDIFSIKNKIIPHFLKYPLRGTKYLDFMSFKKALYIIESNKHLTEDGINELYTISKNMNSYRKFSSLENYSPYHTKENSIDYIPINGHYVNGFIAGDGCLSINLKGKRFGNMYLNIGQHKNNRLLLESIAKYFKNTSKVYSQSINMIQLNFTGIKL
jgi:hypothetical protein